VIRVTARVTASAYIQLQQNLFAVEAKMQRVTAIMAYVVSEGRLCALKPAEWSLLLAGVTLCGIATLLFLILHA
jgi:hypothetical protein